MSDFNCQLLLLQESKVARISSSNPAAFSVTVKRSGESPLGDVAPPAKKRLEILPRAFYVPPILFPEDALQMLMPAYNSAAAASAVAGGNPIHKFIHSS